MDISVWQFFAVKIALGTSLAFGFAWFIRSQSAAYLFGLFGALLMVILPSCSPMLQSDPVAANSAAEDFFWTFIPLLITWLVSALISIRVARVIRWKE